MSSTEYHVGWPNSPEDRRLDRVARGLPVYRPANLELWSKSHPSGQRVVDKIVWARELLALYEGINLP